jgi:putative lipoprotein
MVIAGTVQFPPGPPVTVRALRISIRTIAPADAPDVELAATAIGDIVVPASGTAVPFTVSIEVPAGTQVAVRAHADVTGTGRVQVGDLVSTARHVFPAPHLVVPLEPV